LATLTVIVSAAPADVLFAHAVWDEEVAQVERAMSWMLYVDSTGVAVTVNVPAAWAVIS
jgi:hypothetical protein